MEIGIVGLPLSGKTTLFNLLTRSSAETGFGSGRKKSNVGQSRVPDPRVDRLGEMWKTKKTTHATIRYVDVAGVEQASGHETKGLPAEVVGDLKATDALLVVLRDFENAEVPLPDGSLDPVRDLETLRTEFLFSDLAIVENRIERLAKQKGKVDKAQEIEKKLLERCREVLEGEKRIADLPLDEEERKILRGFQFLTMKPLVVALNVSEADLPRAAEVVAPIAARIDGPLVHTTFLCAPIEKEISELGPEDARAFMDDLGLPESAADRIIRSCYELLGLISFLTMGDDECRAWTIRKGTHAQQAAGTIHSDLERGFIRAEVIRYEDFVAHGSHAHCREKGLVRLEGKEYVVQDGDILNIRFGV
jgi:GTP-binding protein YchF